MKRTLLKTCTLIFTVLSLLVAAGAWQIHQTVPSLPSEPKAPVLAVPSGSVYSGEPGIQAPYDGPHPRLSSRPEETFPFPVRPGQVGPAKARFAGPRQYPFLCGQDESRAPHSQPLVDNQDGYGVPVYARPREPDMSRVIGYSRDCGYPTRVRYYYRQQGSGEFRPLDEADGDIEQISVRGRQVDYIVRYETGTINRFFYAIAVLASPDEEPAHPTGELWNNRLIYQFRGGVGIGWKQGDLSLRYVLRERQRELSQGYAVVFSSGTQSRNHFNIGLAEDTAWRVKRQFTALYGEPEHTIGIGPSGGAIQQYLLAQNAPGLLDGVIAAYAFPDMITQTIHVQDCELLEYFIEVSDHDNPLWDSWDTRSLIQGLRASDTADNRYAPAQRAADFLTGRWSRLEGMQGSSECISGWRGLTPLINNPRFVDNAREYADTVHRQVRWSHWDSLAPVYGRDPNGHAWRTWDNVGVQYGLASLRSGDLPVGTFLKLNRLVGGWKPAAQMAPERFWFLTGDFWPVRLSFWGEHNMTRPPVEGQPAPRTDGHVPAMQAAWLSGEVFTGAIDIPVIDVRHYLGTELDMHHALASFSARSRIRRLRGDAANQLIWVADPGFDPWPVAFDVMDEWLTGADGGHASGNHRPSTAVDRCFNGRGEVIAEGENVWEGTWSGAQADGECLSRYPFHRTSRQVAGDSLRGDVFKCHLQSVDEAISTGVYGDRDMRPHRDELVKIFPSGVCDYRQGGAGMPEGLLSRLRATLVTGGQEYGGRSE